MNDRPLLFRWNGTAMIPLHGKIAGERYTVNEVYSLTQEEYRSSASHKHFFAIIHDAWMQLPEDIMDELPSSEHLRAWALCKAGYCDKEIIKCASNDDAIRLAAITKSAGSKIRIVEVTGKIVTIWTPHSQSVKAMGAKEFQRSKDKILNVIAELIHVDPTTLKREGGMAA